MFQAVRGSLQAENNVALAGVYYNKVSTLIGLDGEIFSLRHCLGSTFCRRFAKLVRTPPRESLSNLSFTIVPMTVKFRQQ